MATKPTLANSRWATDESNNTAPSSGQRDTGWTPGQVAVSDYFNVLGLEAYRWHQYLDDGAFSGALSFVSDISPAAIGNTNDWAPTGLSTAQVIRVDLSSTTVDLTGLTGGADGRVIILQNIHATRRLDLLDESASSSAANRFSLGGYTVRLHPGGNAILMYDSTASRWRLLACHGGVKKITFSIPALAAVAWNGTAWTRSIAAVPDGGYISPDAATTVVVSLGMLAVGDKITAATAQVQADNVNQFTFSIQKITGAGVRSVLGSDTSGTGGGTVADSLDVTGLTEVVGTDAYILALAADAADADLRAYVFRVTVERPFA